MAPFPGSGITLSIEALAKASRTDQHRPPIVLQPGGDKLRFPRRPSIDQRDDRQPLSDIAGSSADPLEAGRFAALDDNDVAFVDEGIGYRDSRLKSAAGVVSQIEDKADHLVAGPLPQILHRIGERRRGSGVEPGNPQIEDVFCLDARGHGLELVALALDA